MILYILSLILVILVYIIYVSQVRLYKYRNLLEESYLESENLLDFISEINRRLHDDYKALKEVDKRGSFESDDEVGFVFTNIKKTVEDSYIFVNKYLKQESDAEKEKEE